MTFEIQWFKGRKTQKRGGERGYQNRGESFGTLDTKSTNALGINEIFSLEIDKSTRG
jgi:hypothetical protein